MNESSNGRSRTAGTDSPCRGELGNVAALVAAEGAGAIQHLPPVSAWSTPTFRVDSGGPVEIALDGEAAVMDPPSSLPRGPEPCGSDCPCHGAAEPR